MTLKDELRALMELPAGVSVDLSRFAYGNDSSYISKVARELSIKVRTELLNGRMMVRIPKKAGPLTDEEVVELDGFGILSMRQNIPARAAELWERELLWGRVTPEVNAFDGLIHKIMK
jgi:hypothetical protein